MGNPQKAARCRIKAAQYREKAAKYRRKGNEINATKCDKEAAIWEYRAARLDR